MMQKQTLVFFTVNSSFSHSSLALPMLHAACRDLPQWHWERVDMTIAEDPAETAVRIAEKQPALVAADLYLFNRNTALDVLKRLHVLRPDCRIAVGGPECLGEGAVLLREEYPFLHALFRGEGERVFREYLLRFDSVESGSIFPADGNAVYEEWNTAPFPAEDPFFCADKPFVQMETSRGCPMGCLYCTSGNTRTRFKELDQVSQELSLLRSKGVKEIRILDRTFNLPESRGAALLRMFREDFPDIRFHLEIHPQFLHEELREELRQARHGQLHIEAGIQTLSPDVQKNIGRKSPPEDALAGLRFLTGCTAFETHVDLLAGLPGQTWNDLLRDVMTLCQAAPAEIQLEILKVLPGTPLRQIAPEYGIRYAPDAPYDVMESDTMTAEEILNVRHFSRLLDLTYNHSDLHEAVRRMDLAALFTFFREQGGTFHTLFDLKKRFLFLAEFLTTAPDDRVLFCLAYHWLCAGYPLRQGPDRFSGKCEAPGPEYRLLSGDASCVTERETKFVRLAYDGTDYILAYNRSYTFNRPAAVFVQ